ncbi:MAG: hypothetical protein FWD67_06815 [Betaproteobacteria bacterium]|nr:hypothetical protein [Betaproteobacteria bacterium]
MNKNTEFYLAQLEPLVGGTIAGLAATEADGFGMEFFGLQVTLPDGGRKVLFFLSDDEGNAPGSFEIIEHDPAAVTGCSHGSPDTGNPGV